MAGPLRSQLCQSLADEVQPTFDFSTLAPYKAIDARVLFVEHIVEGIPELPLDRVALSRDGEGSPGPGRGLVFDQVFEVVIVDVVWKQSV